MGKTEDGAAWYALREAYVQQWKAVADDDDDIILLLLLLLAWLISLLGTGLSP